MNITDVVHFVHIKVRKTQGSQDDIEKLSWTNLRWETRVKFDWYFKYRAALIQVKYPRYYVEFYWGHEEAKDTQLGHIIKNKIKAKKGKLTKFENLLKKAEENWASLFPITEDEFYFKAVAKINKIKVELEELKRI